MLKKILSHQRRERVRNWYYDSHVPRELSRNFRSLDHAQEERLIDSLVANCVQPGSARNSAEVRSLSEEMGVRLRNHRTRIIPWLAHLKSLRGLRILEIGCGNGTSTVALAEQGAYVTAVDIEPGLLRDAEARCNTYGLAADFYLMNATEAAGKLAGQQFDLVVFFAVLEHMTYEERLTSIQQTFQMLAPGGMWCIIGTPNRLHLYDSHTSMLPFFYWLPDELAIRYAKFSNRGEFAGRFAKQAEFSEDERLEFARWGRGMSYHEFELALGALDNLKILSSLTDFLRKRDVVYKYMVASAEKQYRSILQARSPGIHSGFFEPFLDLVIMK